MRIPSLALISVVLMLAMAGCEKDAEQGKEQPKKEPPATVPAKLEPQKKDAAKAGADPFQPGVWVDLFDGKSLEGWKVSEFGGEGKPKVENGMLIVTMGQTLSGVSSTRKDLPKMGYEIALDAQRLEGNDFFCGLTFPVAESHASLILGGWGGQLCGISSINHQDAANNETTKMIEFKEKTWYHVRMRILPARLQAWLDDEQLVDVDTTDRPVDIRIDISESLPFGLATYQTVGAYRNIRVRRLTADELKPKD